MMEVLRFIFSEWYIFLGVLILLSTIGSIVERIITAIEDRK